VRATLDGMAVGDSREIATDNSHSTRTMLGREAKALGWSIITRSTPTGIKVTRLP
jgi:hypothetical protein